jgi:uncharacterized membrane protein YfcA
MFDSVLLFEIAAFLLAGTVKGVLGLGLPTISVGLLSLVMPPVQAAAILVIPSMVTNLWQLALGPGLWPLMRRLGTMMIGICLGTWAGMGLLSADQTAATALGIALMAYAATGLTKLQIRVPARAEPWLSPLIGLVNGGITAATGTFVIPGVPYLQALKLDREELIQALGLLFTVSTLAMSVNLAQAGAFDLPNLTQSVLMLAPVSVGMLAGQWIRTRISAATFRLCFFLGMLALGAHLALRSVL